MLLKKASVARYGAGLRSVQEFIVDWWLEPLLWASTPLHPVHAYHVAIIFKCLCSAPGCNSTAAGTVAAARLVLPACLAQWVCSKCWRNHCVAVWLAFLSFLALQGAQLAVLLRWKGWVKSWLKLASITALSLKEGVWQPLLSRRELLPFEVVPEGPEENLIHSSTGEHNPPMSFFSSTGQDWVFWGVADIQEMPVELTL